MAGQEQIPQHNQRPLENLPGKTFDPADRKTLYAEDIMSLGNSLSPVIEALNMMLDPIFWLNKTYPIGSIYTSVSSANPSELFGGAWVRFGQGQALVGVNEQDPDFAPAEKTGGAKTHTLTVSEIPSHNHQIKNFNAWGNLPITASRYEYSVNKKYNHGENPTNNTGGGQAHNNLQPYVAVYLWKRTA